MSSSGRAGEKIKDNIILRRAKRNKLLNEPHGLFPVIKAIAKRQPLRAVFRDSSFPNSPAKINVGEIFKMLAPDTRVKVIKKSSA